MNDELSAYQVVCSLSLTNDAALMEALAAHQRRRPRDQQVPSFDPSRWTVWAVRSRNYVVKAPRWPGRAWGRP